MRSAIVLLLLRSSSAWSNPSLGIGRSSTSSSLLFAMANTKQHPFGGDRKPAALASRRFSSGTSDATAEHSAASYAASSDASVKFVKPPRVIPDPLPTLYVYDHCPFCVRVRVALGFKNVKHELRFLANDDVATPTRLIGQKIAPIFEYQGTPMKESMDIIQFCEQQEALGPSVILPGTGRTDLKEWQSSVQNLLRGLQRPRYVATGLLPEFQQIDGRHAFINNHPMPPYGKPEWKEMELNEKLSIYAEAMAKDPAGDVEELNIKLVELDDIVFSADHCSPGGVSYDDVDLFSRLRSITIIKDVIWPTKLRSYMDRMAELADLPLYDEMAL